MSLELIAGRFQVLAELAVERVDLALVVHAARVEDPLHRQLPPAQPTQLVTTTRSFSENTTVRPAVATDYLDAEPPAWRVYYPLTDGWTESLRRMIVEFVQIVGRNGKSRPSATP